MANQARKVRRKSAIESSSMAMNWGTARMSLKKMRTRDRRSG